MTMTLVQPTMSEYRQKIQEAASYIRSRTTCQPKVALILGSGLGELADDVSDRVVIPYGEIPNFPVSTAPGHAGNLVLGTLGGQPVMVMQGRFHTYEGYSQKEATFPVRVMKELGVETLIATCATGGLNPNFKAGDLMLLQDHINLSGDNPLVGPNDPELGTRFPVMFDCYTPALRQLATQVAMRQGIDLKVGTYVGIRGPAYFTRAELRFVRQIGADAIGMSMVSEVIAATHAGLKVLGIGTITDMALADSDHHSDEQEILAIARQTGPRFRRLLVEVLKDMNN